MGRTPECRCVYSCSRLLGSSSLPSGRSASISGTASAASQSRVAAVPEVEVERADEGLEARGEKGRSTPAAALRLAFTEEEDGAELDAAGQPGQPDGADDRGAACGQDSLVVVGWRAKSASETTRFTTESPRNSSRSLWACGDVRVFVQIAAVYERLLEQVEVSDRESESLPRERPPDAGQWRVRPPRTRARRCSRPRPGQSGSSPRPRRRSRSRTPPRGS